MSKVNVNGAAFIRKLHLPQDTSNVEGKLYLLNKGGTKSILKPLPSKPTEQRAKKFIVDKLIHIDNKLLIPEFIYPEGFVDIGWRKQFISFSYYPSITLKALLADPGINADLKITYLKLIGDVLNRIRLLRPSIEGNDFAINDLHPDNILIGKKDGKLRFCDLDACKIAGSEAFSSMYLTYYYEYLFKHPKKYITINSTESDMIYPNESTDIFCYIMMIVLQLYCNCENYHLSEEEYYNFLTYLMSIGLNSEIIDIFAKVFTDDDNINPYEFLEMLEGFINNPKVKEFKTTYHS